jgi:ketosteroid isomerase-like protein
MRAKFAPLFAVTLLAACGGGKPSVNLQAEGEKIRALDEKWVKAIADKDVDKVVGVYGADAVFLAPNEPIKSGPELKKAWEDLLKAPNLALSFSPTSISVSDDGSLAYDVGSYRFSMDDPKAGHIDDHGKYLVVWRKPQGGDWRVVADSFNTDVPMQMPADAAGGGKPSATEAAKPAAADTKPVPPAPPAPQKK